MWKDWECICKKIRKSLKILSIHYSNVQFWNALELVTPLTPLPLLVGYIHQHKVSNNIDDAMNDIVVGSTPPIPLYGHVLIKCPDIPHQKQAFYPNQQELKWSFKNCINGCRVGFR